MLNIFEVIKILCVSNLVTVSFSFGNLYCSDEFCKNYLEKNKCENLGHACNVQNITYNGKLFPSITPCNCCKEKHCIQNLYEEDLCTIGTPDMPIPNFVCGPGLICTSGEITFEDYRCKKMQHTTCLKDQISYDKQKNSTGVGLFIQRPICDTDNGLYTSIKCNVGQMCFCVDENGERIFGEAPFEEKIEKTMKCECSRSNLKFNKWANTKYPLLTARCLENGNYDPMQCIDDKCTCVNVNTGAIKYWIAFNFSSVIYDKISCFDKTIHSKYNYLHNCEEKQWKLYKQYQKSIKNGYGVININMPKCQPDGWYLPKQENETHSYCVDKYGRIINTFIVSKNSRESKNMNCNCARTLNIIMKFMDRKMSHKNILPQCCPNGNFKKIQCRSEKCYCSDDNGLQIGIEQDISNVEKLHCYNGGILC